MVQWLRQVGSSREVLVEGKICIPPSKRERGTDKIGKYDCRFHGYPTIA